VKINLLEYVQAPIPDERNFAAVPIFEEAFAQPPARNSFAFPEGAPSKFPPLGTATKNELPDLGLWQQFFVEAKILPAAGDNPAADTLKAVEYYAPQWEQLRTAAARPESRFPVRYEDGVAAALPHLQILQSAARLNALRLLAHLQLGDSAAAYDDFRLGLRLYTALEKEPTLIAGLVRLAGLAMLENAVWTGLARRQWAAPELEKITTDLTRPRLMDDYALGIGSERGFNNMVHEELVQKGTGELANLMDMVNQRGGGKNRAAAAVLYSLYPTGWLRFSQTRSNRYFDEMLRRVSQEPPRIHPERPTTTLPTDMGAVGTVERARYMLFLMLVPALSNVEMTYAYGQTLLEQTRLGCALERHRLAQGSFPASLDALVPRDIPAVPGDVMNGQPLHYRLREDGGYLLYSVASNLQDDHGKSDDKAQAKQQPDWVWSVPAK
jgi:hypothetical protein